MMQKAVTSVGTWCRYQVLKKKSVLPVFSSAREIYTSYSVEAKAKQHVYSDMQNPYQTENDLLEDLGKNIIYEDRDILAINKPNGLPMQALKYSENLPLDVPPPTSAELSVTSVLPDLAAALGTKHLKPIYNQSRLLSGVTIFTKNESAEARLKKYFRKTRQQKLLYQHYWALTVGVPKVQMLDSEVGLRQQKVQDWLMSVVEPKVTKRSRELRQVIRLRMKHDIVETSVKHNCALVHLQPSSTKWQFIEFYLTQQLCAALGDHYYSARVRSVMGQPVHMDPQSSYPAPQVLPDYLLRRLDLTKRETEAIPLHVHCYQIDLPIIKRKSTIIKSISAPLPKFFRRSLDCLDFRTRATKATTSQNKNADLEFHQDLREEDDRSFVE